MNYYYITFAVAYKFVKNLNKKDITLAACSFMVLPAACYIAPVVYWINHIFLHLHLNIEAGIVGLLVGLNFAINFYLFQLRKNHLPFISIIEKNKMLMYRGAAIIIFSFIFFFIYAIVIYNQRI